MASEDKEAAAVDLHAEDVLLNRRLGANGAPLLRDFTFLTVLTLLLILETYRTYCINCW